MQPPTCKNVRSAATVLPLRDSPRSPEMFMKQRPIGADCPEPQVLSDARIDVEGLADTLRRGGTQRLR